MSLTSPLDENINGNFEGRGNGNISNKDYLILQVIGLKEKKLQI